MKKRSAYRPKPVFANPLAYVLESMVPVSRHDSYLLDMKIKNHGAMSSLTQGSATRRDLDVLITMVNITEALYRMGFGEDYGHIVRQGQDALHCVGVRGVESSRFTLKAQEMSHLNDIMELHDAQMDLITIKDMERAMELIKKEFVQKKMRPILEKTA
jgi:hypothetical protein